MTFAARLLGALASLKVEFIFKPGTTRMEVGYPQHGNRTTLSVSSTHQPWTATLLEEMVIDNHWKREQNDKQKENVPPPARPRPRQVDAAIQGLKSNKTAGLDGIPAELLKAAGGNFNRVFHQLLTKI